MICHQPIIAASWPLCFADCHEIHADGQLGDLTTQHQVVIKYNDKERKTFDVFCQHDPRHSNHQLIDNHISTEPYDLSNKKEKQAGWWPLNDNMKYPCQYRMISSDVAT